MSIFQCSPDPQNIICLSASSAVHHENVCSLSVMIMSIVKHVIVGLTLTSFHRFIDPLENQSYQRNSGSGIFINFSIMQQSTERYTEKNICLVVS